MKQIKIFVKYCGGCNPHFNRKAYSVDFIEKLGAIKVSSPAEADYILVLNGCHCQCVTGGENTIAPVYHGKILTVEELMKRIEGGEGKHGG